MGRSKSKNRCERCYIHRPLCLCGEIKPIQLQTRVLVLMHWREQVLTTNSARLACLALENSEIRLRGEKNPAAGSDALPDFGKAILLFPSEDALELNAELAKKLSEPVTLIVPDGTWRQARRIAHRTSTRSDILRVKLPVGAPSEYRLRKESRPDKVSTFEAIARALGILEGPERGPLIQQELEALFLKMVERRLVSRGKLPNPQTAIGSSI